MMLMLLYQVIEQLVMVVVMLRDSLGGSTPFVPVSVVVVAVVVADAPEGTYG